MQISKLPFEHIPQLSALDLAYSQENAALQPFYKYPVRLESFLQVIADKEKNIVDRGLLLEVLREQHANYTPSDAVRANINALGHANTFTVVTAHQPCLFTGPLYYIYKIISAINLVRKLQDRFSEYHFVPVFISGGEDHDFEETNHCHLFGKKLTWENSETGPVGKMSTSSLTSVLAQLQDILGNSTHAETAFNLVSCAHTLHAEYGTAACLMVHELFQSQGLVVLNTFDARLKRAFIPVIQEEILEQVSHALVSETIADISTAGFAAQAPPREINFFYLGDQFRERIVFEDGAYRVLNTEFIFSSAEMKREIEQHPERFSPNVVMRPLFQETILPNLAYIGGGGELAYWLERKRQFEHFGVNFPMLVRRDSALWIDQSNSKRLRQLGFTTEDLFKDADALIRKYLHDNANVEIELTSEKEEVKKLFDQIAARTEQLDHTLVKTVLAEKAKVLNSMEFLEVKLMRAEKQKHDNAVNQIRSLKEKLFPHNGLQERHDNFLQFYVRYGSQFAETLLQSFDPLDKSFTIIEDIA